MKKLDLDNVEEAKDFPKLVPGGYICRIINVEDESSKEYLKIYFDIVEGQFKGHYQGLWEAKNFWGGNFIRSYKEKALPFFKGFITAVENSNPGYKFDNDETKLKGKLIGIVLQEEEYEANDGSVKVKLSVQESHSINKIRNKDFKIKDIKKLEGRNTNITSTIDYSGESDKESSAINIMDDDIQF